MLRCAHFSVIPASTFGSLRPCVRYGFEGFRIRLPLSKKFYYKMFISDFSGMEGEQKEGAKKK